MRCQALLVVLLFALPIRAEAQDASARTLRGHTFVYPATIDPAFVQTTFGLRTSARYATVGDLPTGNGTIDVTSLGVRENVDFEIALAERWAVGASALGQFVTGTTGRALIAQGALYSYGASVNGAFRILRLEDTGTQVTARLQMFGVQGGGQIGLVPLVRAVRNEPSRGIPDVATNLSDLLITPSSWFGFAGSVNVAQAISEVFAVQASFRLDVKRFTRSPFVPGRGRVDIDATGWLPSAGVAFGASPPSLAAAFLAEYRIAAQDDDDPSSGARHIVALGAYYTGRTDLQLGLTVFGEFGLPELAGFDADGNPASSKRGTAFSGQLLMRYFW
jgi:hypothetical protein